MTQLWVALRTAMLRTYNADGKPVDRLFPEGSVINYIPGMETNHHFAPANVQGDVRVETENDAPIPYSAIPSPELIEAQLVEAQMKDAEAREEQIKRRANASVGNTTVKPEAKSKR